MRLPWNALKTPWWWTLIVRTSQNIQNIHERAALDAEKMVAPKNFWLSPRKLERWYDEREDYRKQLQSKR